MPAAATQKTTAANAVIYARYSSHNQTEQSIEGQLSDAYEFARREGYQVIGEYIDRAQSATTDRRADFQRMINDAAKHQFGTVIVWKMDRFARNRYDSAIYKTKLKKHNVKVVSVMENITDTPEGVILEAMLDGMAEYYSRNLSVNVKRGMRETIKKGRFAGGSVPLGYRLEDGHLYENEKTAWVVRYMFEQYAQGVPKKEIMDYLISKGVRSTRGSPLTVHCLQTVLRNETYLGRFHYNGEVVPGVADQLIDEETFRKAQTFLQKRAYAPASFKAREAYLLQGKVFCGHCGAPMIGESGHSSTGAVYNYYTCATRKKAHTCKKKNEKKGFLEWYVVDQTARWVLDPNELPVIAKAVANEYKREFNSGKIEELERQQQKLEQDLETLVDSLLEVPKAARGRIYERMELLEAQKADLQEDIAKLTIAQGIKVTAREVTAWLRQFVAGDPLDPAYQQRIISALVNSVYIYDDRIMVFINIKGNTGINFADIKKALDESYDPPGKSSDLKSSGAPDDAVSERPEMLFVFGVLGLIISREKRAPA